MRQKIVRQFIAAGNKEEIENVIEEGLPEVLNEWGETPLMWAIAHGYKTHGEEIFKLILAQEQDYNRKDASGFSALSYAMSLRRPTYALAILEKGVDVNVPCRVTIAPNQRAYLEHRRSYFSEHSKPYPTETEQTLSPLSFAIYKSYDELIYRLVDMGADLDNVGGLDITPLSMAVRADKIDVLQYLLEKGANPNILPSNWQSYTDKPEKICPVAIKKALKYGSGAAISLLLKAGSRLPKRFLRRNDFYSTPLTYLFSQPKDQLAAPYYCLRQLQKRVDKTVCDSDQRSPLSHAVENRFHSNLIESLLDDKINNLPDKYACTPMIYAWDNRDFEVMSVLYRAGVPMASNVYEPTGQTILMLSLEKKDYQMVSFLLKHNPMLLNKDKKGRTVLSYIDERTAFFEEISEAYRVQKEKFQQHMQQKRNF